MITIVRIRLCCGLLMMCLQFSHSVCSVSFKYTAQTFLYRWVLRCWIPISKIEMRNKISPLYNLGAASGTLGFKSELLVAIVTFSHLFAEFSLVLRV